jgi:putative oxygen-independent coproporphyrinogen III oxidase
MEPVSVYIHWPFCLSLCPYCDFNSHISAQIDPDLWIQAYKQEITHFQEKLLNRKIKSIFFGGGTPSLMDPKIVESVIDYLSNIATLSDETEITLEANPTSYEAEKFRNFKSAGVNRVSIGVQSLKNETLNILGRKHSSKEAIFAIESAAGIFDRYSFDLIYSVPKQTLKDWQAELKEAIKLANGHISLYQLTIEKGTPFYQTFQSGKMQLPSNNVSADMYEWTNKFLKKHNYHAYEISNYATSGNECIHNLTYWNYDEYIGFGPGAHSRLHKKNQVEAVMMIHKPDKWLESVNKKGHGIQTSYSLSKKELIEEVIMMGTRLKSGISIKKTEKLIETSFDNIVDKDKLSLYLTEGFIFKNDTHFGLTESGLILHNYLISRLL